MILRKLIGDENDHGLPTYLGEAVQLQEGAERGA